MVKGYDYKIGLKKTAKNVGVVMTPAIVLEIVQNIFPLVPEEYKVVAQIVLGAIAYFVKNASENGAWK